MGNHNDSVCAESIGQCLGRVDRVRVRRLLASAKVCVINPQTPQFLSKRLRVPEGIAECTGASFTDAVRAVSG